MNVEETPREGSGGGRVDRERAWRASYSLRGKLLVSRLRMGGGVKLEPTD